MTVFKPLALVLLVAAATLSACEKEPDSYPVTGETCAPTDPVQTLDAADCYVPPAVN